MFRDNLLALFQLYVKPVAALSRILDRGRLWFSAAAALLVSFLLHFTDFGPRIGFVGGSLSTAALFRFIGYEPGAYLSPLLAVVIAMIPAMIAVRARLGFGSAAVLMRSQYVPLLICVLMGWAAAYLPLTIARLSISADWLDSPLVYAASNLYFVILAALSARTAFGADFGPALGLAAAGWVGGVIGTGVLAIIGSFSYLIWLVIIYFLYRGYASEAQGLGEGLRSGRHLREQLEIATTNPHDGDAHYQLGLIYQKRRQYSEAIARFERAVAIDPEEADAHYQLGRIAREQGRYQDAIGHLKAAAALDDQLSMSQVWRELGASYLAASQLEDARAALAKFVGRHSYEPEGLYWYGKVLARMDQPAQAREMFEQCIDAVKTMPPHLRADAQKWRRQAQAELRAIK